MILLTQILEFLGLFFFILSYSELPVFQLESSGCFLFACLFGLVFSSFNLSTIIDPETSQVKWIETTAQK